MALGYETIGSGPMKILILNDWLGDASSWRPAHAYLDGERFTWTFADLRGYGRSKEQSGKYNLLEAANDVVELANALGWEKFCLVGHSMSSLVALHLAQHIATRVERVVALTPPPIGAPPLDPAILDGLVAIAHADDATRMQGLKLQWGDRLSEGWIRFKAARWRETSHPDAVAAYAAMFARDGLPDLSTKIAIPVLAVTGEKDAPHMRSELVTKFLGRLWERLEVVPIADSAHYPMQETPPLLVAIVERFLAAGAA